MLELKNMCETKGNADTKITPSVAELSTVNNSIACTECSSTFSSSTNRDLHLAKRHKRGCLPLKADSVKFHCPTPGCIYETQRHFAKRKYVKQHYLKVHAAKSFRCDCCESGFSTASALKRHIGVCGQQFQCPCGLWYTSSEALATHTLRAGHRKPAEHEPRQTKGLRPLPTAPVYLAAVALSELSSSLSSDKGIQTESPRQRGASTQTGAGRQSRGISAHTQTAPCVRIAPKLANGTAETQAAPLASKVTQTSGCQVSAATRKRKSAQTQTALSDKQATSKARREARPPGKLTGKKVGGEARRQGESTDDGDFEARPANDKLEEMFAGADDGLLKSEGLLDALWAGQLLDSETQTEPEPSLLEQLLDCETQTELGEADSLGLDALYCHSTTQTCDHFLFPELGCCHDMHTQTEMG